MADCNSIARLVDALGTVELLAIAAAPSDSDVAVHVEVHKTRAGATSARKDGLHFSGAHWYSRKAGKTRNSYDERYQKDGSAHFCKTFAVMIHRGNDDLPADQRLEPGDYAKNIIKAMKFWRAFFKDNVAIRRWFVDQIDGMSYASLKLELQDIVGSAARLTNCRYG